MCVCVFVVYSKDEKLKNVIYVIPDTSRPLLFKKKKKKHRDMCCCVVIKHSTCFLSKQGNGGLIMYF